MKKLSKLVHEWTWVVLLSFCVLGVIYPVIGIGAIICMLAPVIVAFFKGRKWCGTYCPRGSFNDIILSKLTLKRKIPALLTAYWFRIILLSLILSGFGIQLVLSWGNIAGIGQIFVRMIIITTLVAIFLGIGYNHRTWCLICPMGTMAGFAARNAFKRRRAPHIRFIEDKCIDCRLCTKSCPMNIDVHRYKLQSKVTHADCIQCRSCVDKCPRKSLYIA